MSKIVWEAEEVQLIVSTFCGPAGPPDRRRWQFLVAEGLGPSAVVDIDTPELASLVATLDAELGEPGV